MTLACSSWRSNVRLWCTLVTTSHISDIWHQQPSHIILSQIRIRMFNLSINWVNRMMLCKTLSVVTDMLMLKLEKCEVGQVSQFMMRWEHWVSESVSQWVRATRVKLWSPKTNDNFRHLETRWEWNCLQPNLTFFLSNINLSRITLTSHSMFNQICMKLQRLTNRPALQAISSFMAGDSCLQSY